jgi:hypothetical protein
LFYDLRTGMAVDDKLVYSKWLLHSKYQLLSCNLIYIELPVQHMPAFHNSPSSSHWAPLS